MAYTLTVPPAALPVDLETAKLHLRVDHDDEDVLIAAFLESAITHLDGRDGVLGRALLAQTWQATFAAPDCEGGFTLELGAVTAATKVERMVEGAYVEVPDEDWRWNKLSASRLRVTPISGGTWPSGADSDLEAWRVTFTAGAANASGVPAPIIAGILLIVGDLYRNPESKVANVLVENKTVDRLIGPYRLLLV